MYGTILILIISIIIVIFIIQLLHGIKDFVKELDFDSIGGTLFGIFIVFLIGCGIRGIIDMSIRDHKYKKISFKIKSINDRFSSEGSFILGSGSIENTEYYYYYYNTNKGYKLGKKDTDYCYINEWNKSYGKIEYDVKYKESTNWFLSESNKRCSDYIIYVPKNTIISKYRLDLK